ncbi:tyrosine-type recombinase/integrase [Deinococcus xinjiangensis]
MIEDTDWESLSKKERAEMVKKALKKGDAETLVSLTSHNLVLYGRGGAATSPHTIRSYRAGVRQFLRYAFAKGWKRLLEYDTDLTIGYIRGLQKAGVTPGTINNRRSAAKAFYRALRWAGLITADPFADTPRAQEQVEKWEKREAYSKEDLAKLMAVADPDERLFLLLGSHAGLRISEMISVTWARVDMQARTMKITGKGNKTALVHMSSALHEALESTPAEMRQEYLLPWRNPKTLRLVLRSLCVHAGVKYAKRQVHGLRHSCATNLLADTGDLYVVARHLRHSSVSTTETYAKVNPERLTSALRKWADEAGAESETK